MTEAANNIRTPDDLLNIFTADIAAYDEYLANLPEGVKYIVTKNDTTTFYTPCDTERGVTFYGNPLKCHAFAYEDAAKRFARKIVFGDGERHGCVITLTEAVELARAGALGVIEMLNEVK